MTDLIHPVLMCGGAGTRLWPLSRRSYPKQFARLTEDRSLYQESAQRLTGDGFAAPMILTIEDFRFIVLEQAAALGITPADVLIEPAPRNTAPAICAAALALEDRDPGALMLVAPSDHLIPDAEGFRQTIRAGVAPAQSGQIVTFGIRPDRAETGYGWLEMSGPTDDFTPIPQPLKSFVEKPDEMMAQALLDGQQHLWNAGIFLFTTTTILQAFATHAPDILDSCRTAWEARQMDLAFTRLDAAAWDDLPEISVDYAIMEKSSDLTVIPYAGAWSDLGDWQAVWRESAQDRMGVALNGPATAIDCADTLLQATNAAQPVIGIGLSDIITVAMPDAVLVAHKDRAQDVKEAVAALKAQGVPQAETLPRDYRPWGWYESLVVGARFQVKRIVVNAGGAMSLQSHVHRAEHWVVVEGTAQVTVDDQVTLVSENQSIFIPLGAVHRLENPGKLPLTLIEVQTGGYLGEDDITRYEDAYARELTPKS